MDKAFTIYNRVFDDTKVAVVFLDGMFHFFISRGKKNIDFGLDGLDTVDFVKNLVMNLKQEDFENVRRYLLDKDLNPILQEA